MTLELLVSAVDKDVRRLAEEMKICSDAIIINQCDHNDYDEWEREGFRIRAYSFNEKGVGLSRNSALLRADHDISVFADEDIVYAKGYRETILSSFEKYPEADMLLFNMDVAEERETYHIDKFGRVRRYNCGRYPTYSFAIKTDVMHKKNITFSLLFGGGAKYSNGEDSLFIKECITKGLKVFKVPKTIGREVPRPSTWFKGYNRKFFFDRGVLYYHLYGALAYPLSIRFLLAHKKILCNEIPYEEALKLMKRGIREGKG